MKIIKAIWLAILDGDIKSAWKIGWNWKSSKRFSDKIGDFINDN